MKFSKACSVFLLIVLCLNCIAFSTFALEDQTIPDTTVTHGFHSMNATSAYLGSEQRVKNVGSALLYEINSDTLMYSWNADQKMYPSSLVKILTALIAVEQGDLQSLVTASQSALDTIPYYAASIDLKAGEQISLSDLVYAMMVGSANDAAAVIATHIGGSAEGFVNMMNAYAERLGCTATHFTNVHGLHDENQYTTARDMARILAAAVKNENFLTYFSEINYIVPATNMTGERELSSGNFLMNTENMQLYYDARVTGGRTGTTEDGNRCLATLAKENGMNLVCIVMGSESTFDEDGNTVTYGSFQETSTLLDACFTGYQVSQILYENQILRQCEVPNGENDVILGCKKNVYSVLPKGVTLKDLSFQYGGELGLVAAPVEAGQVLTDLQVWHGGFCIAQAQMIAMNSVRQAGSHITELDPKNNSLQIVIIVILSVVCGAFTLVFVIRGVRYLPIVIRKRRIKQYKRSRRRSR